ncbi:transcriptional regulator, AraC family [Noviherbaspirillum humi]|uniref:Transcriptional regulator, AraC family n=1 Tax=Noviherbaspirillum humi TaxID=1688639 RepID=A0A239KDV9_9BURK|nr:helix-turn-helix transcriptional regulator [Noviherbaspirillum humi]SNT15839.1 transcriptional regulator, AraC family [Noviherbaspirillum humi]
MRFIDPDGAENPVFVLVQRYDAGEGNWHVHRRAQLIQPGEGVLTVRTDAGVWVVPPQRAVWILPGERHQVSAAKAFLLRSLYVDASAAPIPSRSGVIFVDRLLDALMAEAATFGHSFPSHGMEQRLLQVILDRLGRLDVVPSWLPMPTDGRLLRLIGLLDQDPAEARTLDTLAGLCGMTGRTAARLFLKQTGLTFSHWRQQFRLLKAIHLLSMGKSVTYIALEVGYRDVSSFITVFKEAFGETPARYFQSQQKRQERMPRGREPKQAASRAASA